MTNEMRQYIKVVMADGNEEVFAETEDTDWYFQYGKEGEHVGTAERMLRICNNHQDNRREEHFFFHPLRMIMTWEFE